MSEAEIKGWCPTPSRPMQSGDGLLVRLVPPLGGYGARELHALARLARAHGTGAIEITQRRNLQLRGFSEASFAAYWPEAVAARLASPEAALALMAAPSLDFDGTAAADPRRLHGQILALPEMRQPERFPAKFCIAIGSGGVAGIDDLWADIRLDPVGTDWSVALCGPALEALPVAHCSEIEALNTVRLLLRHYPSSDGRRGKGHDFAIAWAKRAGCELAFTDRKTAATQQLSNALWPVFGRLDADAVQALAEEAGKAGFRVLPGPERSLLASNHFHAEEWAASRSTQFLAPTDPRRFVDVCSGSRGCRQGHADTLADAVAFAARYGNRLSPATRLHVSGCSKGCARPDPASFTLTATTDGYRFARNATALDALTGSRMTEQAA
jgi:precorrin-3B synthase